MEAQGLTRILPGDPPVTLVQDASLTVEKGSFTAIVGPSGCGKSSLLYLLGLIDRPGAGTLLIDGKDMSPLDGDQRARLRLERIGFVFQFHFLLPEFSALQNVLLPMRKLGRLSNAAAKERAMELLDSVGLRERAGNTPDKLSGGERQRVAIVRALANDPAIVLGDEPTGNLDSANGREIMQMLTTLNREGATIVIATHSADHAAQADRIVRLSDGRIVADR